MEDDVFHDIPLLRSKGRATTFARWTLPLGALAGLLASILIVFPSTYGEFYGFLAAYLIPPAGKESVIPAMVAAHFKPFLVATYIAGLDITLAWLLAWNWDSLTALPRVGELVERMMERGHAWMTESRFANRSAFFGLVVFVFFPLQGSGAVAGTALGRLIGLPAHRAWVAIMIGSLLAAFTWAYAADGLQALVITFGLNVVLHWGLVLLASAVFVGLVARRIHHG